MAPVHKRATTRAPAECSYSVGILIQLQASKFFKNNEHPLTGHFTSPDGYVRTRQVGIKQCDKISTYRGECYFCGWKSASPNCHKQTTTRLPTLRIVVVLWTRSHGPNDKSTRNSTVSRWQLLLVIERSFWQIATAPRADR